MRRLRRRLRVNSRSLSGFQTKAPLPASVSPGEGFWARMMPVDGDWRLDAFGARYTPLSLNFEVRVSSPARVSAEVARNNFVACVVSNSSYLEAYETSRVHAGADGAQQLLLEYTGPTNLHNSSSARAGVCQDDRRSWVFSDIARDGADMYSFHVSGEVPELTR